MRLIVHLFIGLLLGIVGIFFACKACNENVQTEQQNVKDKFVTIYTQNMNGDLMTEFEYDGCRYILYDGDYNGGIIHKGNCYNQIHADSGE